MTKDRLSLVRKPEVPEPPPPVEIRGLTFQRHFTRPEIDPYEELEWEARTALIQTEKGEIVFQQAGVEVPKGWSVTATNVVASKYFRGKLGAANRESSVRQLIDRVVKGLVSAGRQGQYFGTDEDEAAFASELTYLLVNQRASFNSPVWFNLGIEERPQTSACFINSVKDTMDSILDLAKAEGMLFKYGSGTGTNLSPIRSSKERLSTGGQASGPVSFMKGYDAFAGVIKSGGRTRRAAKMVILNADHPDIVEFVRCKETEEKKAWALIEAGYDPTFNGEAYRSVFFQNSNNSVRVSDDFMRAVIDDKEWKTRAITTGEVMDSYRARDLMRMVAEATHVCGDPGMQFDGTINDWHTCPAAGRINASNPCSEYMFLDDSACNLASINLMKFRDSTGEFDVEGFRRAVQIMITAQDILVDSSSYPTPAITRNSQDFRPLGLGYANLGALLMARGLPYDSDEGRAYAAAITALMSGEAYRASATLASARGSFVGFQKNREPMLKVIRKHRKALGEVSRSIVPPDLLSAARRSWDEAVELGERFGYRNAQVSVLAPTGTIGFMMDCDTTGVEPDIALVKFKKLAGDGCMKIVNQTVPEALARLGYPPEQVTEIVNSIDENGTIEGAPNLEVDHLAVFDCAFRPANGSRSIHWMGHLRMMAAVQPFLSGAISKTVNCPPEATVDDITKAFVDAWKMGLKALAVYRDGSKRIQPVSTTMSPGQGKKESKPGRRRLPDERRSITHKFSVGGHEGYLTVGMYDDETPGEMFITMAKEGSVVSGLMHVVAEETSIALQYGVPLGVLVNKFSHTRFEPSGYTNNVQIPIAKSLVDYIFRWLALKFMPESREDGETQASTAAAPAVDASRNAQEGRERQVFLTQADAPPCHVCGSIMVRNGACYKCLNCGSTSGCS
ncbi:MAG: vitamin B12-dependent ribonucleotide reductase [Candidatus Riflebacteria bacterium]|nr:vitamin B12-dependent ribonucleotide reductase [Candidatus Riflebacteria bacterium]